MTLLTLKLHVDSGSFEALLLTVLKISLTILIQPKHSLCIKSNKIFFGNGNFSIGGQTLANSRSLKQPTEHEGTQKRISALPIRKPQGAVPLILWDFFEG